MHRPKTKILVDGGDPEETRQIKELLGFVDGQTTNPSLIAKNPRIRQLIASGHKLSSREEMDEYKKIVQTISPLVGDAGVSIEVFSDEKTTAQEMLSQGKEMFSWIPNAYIVSVHGGRTACCTDVCQGASQGEHDTLLLATAGSGGVLSNQGHEGARLCFAFRRTPG